jgi:hypothetical protein
MSLSLPFNQNSLTSQIISWTAANPVITRFALLALPVAAGLAMAALGQHGFHFLPPTGGGSGGCGGMC